LRSGALTADSMPTLIKAIVRLTNNFSSQSLAKDELILYLLVLVRI
jgi:hypothetical protein